MCHMIADTHDELIQMANKISINLKHIQYKGLPKEHFDICKSKRDIAISNGAIQVSSKDIVMKIKSKKL
jgi:hypothetical protein